MPDAIDRAQAMNDLHAENALQAHQSRPRTIGLTHCENLDCREPISATRRELGARLCVSCATEEEAERARVWGRGR